MADENTAAATATATGTTPTTDTTTAAAPAAVTATTETATTETTVAVQAVTTGRIVHFVDEVGVHLPGIVVAVSDKDNINIQAFLDGNGVHYAANIPYSNGLEQNTWHWPETN